MDELAVIVRRVIHAPRERVFAAWTEPELLPLWWGPQGITCTGYEVDLREGGAYRIGNHDGSGVLWIGGTFEAVVAPERLVFTWAHQPVTEDTEISRVTVRFEVVDGGTEVVVVHTRVAQQASRERHRVGWAGCLAGLQRWAAGGVRAR